MLIVSFSTTAQLTQNNEPKVGESLKFYVCDSTFSDAASIKGTNVLWDFSTINSDANNSTKTMTVSSANNTKFSGATYVSDIPGVLSTYWSSTSTSRNSHGFVFSDPTNGDITISFSSDQEILMNYPFDVNSSLTDNFSGNLYHSVMSPTGSVCSGDIKSEIDGSGTLKLPGNNNFSNVIRHKIVETSNSNIVIPGLGASYPVKVIRTQYDYYDIGNSSFPIFSYINISYDATVFNGNVKYILSTVNPTINPQSTAGITSIDEIQFHIYPNPSNDFINIDVDSGVDMQIIDPNGREMFNKKLISGHQVIDISMLESGVYFVRVIKNGKVTVKRLVIQ